MYLLGTQGTAVPVTPHRHGRSTARTLDAEKLLTSAVCTQVVKAWRKHCQDPSCLEKLLT